MKIHGGEKQMDKRVLHRWVWRPRIGVHIHMVRVLIVNSKYHIASTTVFRAFRGGIDYLGLPVTEITCNTSPDIPDNIPIFPLGYGRDVSP
jgi:hypothetical protein